MIFWSDSVGGLGEYTVYHYRVSFFLFGFIVTSMGLSGGAVFMLHTSLDVIPCRDVPFEGYVDISPI